MTNKQNKLQEKIKEIEKEFKKKWESIYVYDRDTAKGHNPYLPCKEVVWDFIEAKLTQLTQDYAEEVLEEYKRDLNNSIEKAFAESQTLQYFAELDKSIPTVDIKKFKWLLIEQHLFQKKEQNHER